MSKVEQWIACDLRYVAETKLSRLSDDELAKLYFGLGKKHSLSLTSVSADRSVMIEKLMQMKKEIQVAYGKAEAEAKAQVNAETAKAVEHIFGVQEAEPEKGEGEKNGEEAAEEAVPELTEEELEVKRDREERAAAFIQLAAAIAAEPEPAPPADAETGQAEDEVRPSSPVTVDTHHRLRVCSFNACKMRLGSANKAYAETSECADKDEYEGTHKGAELAQKWLTLAARMADFDAIVLQEVPGTEKVMNEKVETFAAMLEIATEEGQYWTAVSSQKSGKDGKVVGTGAEVHVCFVKSPVEFKGWNTLRKVGATELDYAPLQVVLHDPRFADPADQSFVVTSVHLPPSKRVDARDSQIAALLRNYSAPDTSEYRMQLPFKPSKEMKTPPTHIIAGDFNTYPGNEQYNMLGSGFVSKIPKNAATTSGHQNYDNVLVDTHANDRLLIGGGILQLKDPHNAAKGEVGLSDHYPVFVEVCEVQKTGKPKPEPLPEVVHRQAYEEEPSVEEREALALIAPPVIVQADAVEPPLETVNEEEEEEEAPAAAPPPPPPLEYKQFAPGDPRSDWDGVEPSSDEDLDSDALTDGPPELPRGSDDEEEEEQAVREVVSAAMEQVAQLVVAAAAATEAAAELTSEEAPPAAAASTQEAPSTPPLLPEPAPASPSDPSPVQAEEQAEEQEEEQEKEEAPSPTTPPMTAMASPRSSHAQTPSASEHASHALVEEPFVLA
jgi:endonuclease/exonuclease/phosphatase family metal-dependent hydrolase